MRMGDCESDLRASVRARRAFQFKASLVAVPPAPIAGDAAAAADVGSISRAGANESPRRRRTSFQRGTKDLRR